MLPTSSLSFYIICVQLIVDTFYFILLYEKCDDKTFQIYSPGSKR